MDTPLNASGPSTSGRVYTGRVPAQQMEFASAFGRCVEAYSGAVIRMAAENGQGAIDLLREHRPHQKVRPGLRTEGQASSRLHSWPEIESIRAADQKREIACAGIAHRAQHLGEGFAGHSLAARVERNDVGAGGNAPREFFAFLGDTRARLSQPRDPNFLTRYPPDPLRGAP